MTPSRGQAIRLTPQLPGADFERSPRDRNSTRKFPHSPGGSLPGPGEGSAREGGKSMTGPGPTRTSWTQNSSGRQWDKGTHFFRAILVTRLLSFRLSTKDKEDYIHTYLYSSTGGRAKPYPRGLRPDPRGFGRNMLPEFLSTMKHYRSAST